MKLDGKPLLCRNRKSGMEQVINERLVGNADLTAYALKHNLMG